MAKKKKEEFFLDIEEKAAPKKKTPKKKKDLLNFSYRDTSDLIPYARNAKIHTDEQITKIAASIREFGFMSPVVLDKDNTILAGHGRVLAAKKLGMEEVPTVQAEHLSEAQRKAYILADNRTAEEHSGWDNELLKIELEELEELDFNVDSFFSFGDVLLPEFIPEPPKNSDTEIDESEFSEFKHTCPKCGFGFDKG